MTLYDIDARVAALIDPETGEIVDSAAFDALEMDRAAALENLAVHIKNMRLQITATQAVEDRLKAQRQRIEMALEHGTERLKYYLAGQPLESHRVKCSWRKSTAVALDDSFIKWASEQSPELLRYKTPEPDKKAITAALKGGQKIPGARLEDRMNLTII